MSAHGKDVNEEVLERTVERCRERGIIIPTYKQMKDPALIPEKVREKLRGIGLWDIDSLNLFRITWKNEPVPKGGGFGGVNFVELPPELIQGGAPPVLLVHRHQDLIDQGQRPERILHIHVVLEKIVRRPPSIRISFPVDRTHPLPGKKIVQREIGNPSTIRPFIPWFTSPLLSCPAYVGMSPCTPHGYRPVVPSHRPPSPSAGRYP